MTIYRNTGFVEGYMHHILKIFRAPEYLRDLVTASFCRMPRDVTKIFRSIHSFYIRSLDNQQHVTGERPTWTCKTQPEIVSKVIWFSVGLGKNMWCVEYCSRVTSVDAVCHMTYCAWIATHTFTAQQTLVFLWHYWKHIKSYLLWQPACRCTHNVMSSTINLLRVSIGIVLISFDKTNTVRINIDISCLNIGIICILVPWNTKTKHIVLSFALFQIRNQQQYCQSLQQIHDYSVLFRIKHYL